MQEDSSVSLEMQGGNTPSAVLYIVGGSGLSIVGQQRICDEIKWRPNASQGKRISMRSAATAMRR
jgi:hypothetical protein